MSNMTGNVPKEGRGGDDDGIIAPGHTGPILNAPRDNIPRKGIPHSNIWVKPWTYGRWNICRYLGAPA